MIWVTGKRIFSKHLDLGQWSKCSILTVKIILSSKEMAVKTVEDKINAIKRMNLHNSCLQQRISILYNNNRGEWP